MSIYIYIHVYIYIYMYGLGAESGVIFYGVFET